MRAKASFTALTLALAVALWLETGCTASAPADLPEVAHVSQATIDARRADGVFGQPDFVRGVAPVLVSIDTVNQPAGLAVSPLSSPETILIADRGESRILARTPSTFSSLWLFGQSSFAEGRPNGGGSPTLATLNAPDAVAVFSTLIAFVDSGNHRVIVRGFGTDFVLGQHGNPSTNNRNDGGISSTSLAEPGGAAFLTNDGETRLFVSDTGNHRVIGFRGAATSANWLIGQGSFGTADPNRGRTTPTANTFDDPHGLAAHDRESFLAGSLFGLWIADTGDHRVLHFSWCRGELGDDPCPNADIVLGQPDYDTATPGTSETSLRAPTAVAVDVNGGVWVADTGNNRVVHFPRRKVVADIVLGQPDFTSHAAPTSVSDTTLDAPQGVAIDAHGHLYVSDTGANRVLRYLYVFKAADCDDGDPCTFDSFTAGACQHSVTTFAPECSPYLCDTVKHACQTSCIPGAGCQGGSVCTSTGRCVRPCSGTTISVCPTGKQCADGWCCDKKCEGQCESCGVPGSEGLCSAIPSGRAPETFNIPGFQPRATCASSNSGDAECAGSCDGSHRDECAKSRAKTTCGYEACNDGVATLRGQCDGAGTCVLDQRACGTYACDVGGCRKTCSHDFHCAAGALCVGGACVSEDHARAGGDGCEIGSAPLDAPSHPFAWAAVFLGTAAIVRATRRRR